MQRPAHLQKAYTVHSSQLKLAEELSIEGKHREAMSLLHEVHQSNLTNPTVMARYGEAAAAYASTMQQHDDADLRRKGVLEEGVNMLDKCIEVVAGKKGVVVEGAAECYAWRAQLGKMMGEGYLTGSSRTLNDMAVYKWAKQATELDPYQGKAHNICGDYHVKYAPLSDRVGLYAPSPREKLMHWFYRNMSEWPQGCSLATAAKHYEAAHRATPNYIENAHQLGDVQRMRGDYERARDMYCACGKMRPFVPKDQTLIAACVRKHLELGGRIPNR